MSRIADLISKHCPEGVEFRPLCDVFDTRNGYTPSKSDVSLWEEGTIPWIRMEDIRNRGGVLDDAFQHITQSAVKGGRLFPANSILVATSATIGVHALVTVPHLSNQRFTSLALKTEFVGALDPKFIYYYCFVLDGWCIENTTTSSFATVDMKRFKEFPFPIPPMEAQREIVRILDRFTKLDAELVTALEAELEARSHQYEYYRNALLSSDRAALVRKPMGEVGEFVRGNGLLKSDLRDKGVPAIHYGQLHSHYGEWTKSTLSFADPALASKLRRASPGDVIVATTSEDDASLGKATAWLGDGEVAVSGDAYIFRHSLDPRYVAHFFRCREFEDQKRRHISGTKVRRISGKALSEILIPVPSRQEQEEVVAVLDKFDALIEDLSTGLPAELKLRGKQYEYYRDQLLTFEAAA